MISLHILVEDELNVLKVECELKCRCTVRGQWRASAKESRSMYGRDSSDGCNKESAAHDDRVVRETKNQKEKRVRNWSIQKGQ